MASSRRGLFFGALIVSAFGFGGPITSALAQRQEPAPECPGTPGPVFTGEHKAAPLPPSIERQIALNAVPENRLPALDQAALMARNDCGGKCLQIGIARDLSISMQHGQWINVGDGMLWTSDIVVENAVAVRVHFTNIDLPEGASLVAYAPELIEGNLIMAGPYEGHGLFDHGSLWTQEIPGARVRVECFVPNHPKLNLAMLNPFSIDLVQHIYRDPLMEARDLENDPTDTPTNCTDVTCQATWANQAKAVARITYVNGGTFLCTGQLLNSQAIDQTPYFLTANHCISSNAVANTATFYWKYQSATCGGAAPPLGSVPTSTVATLVSTGAASDYSLLLIEGALPCDLYWLGWLTGAIPNGTSGACIHHPGGTWKRIALGTKQNTFGCGGGSHIGVDWTGPTGTEPGSSGSAFILPASGGQVIGQLHCGPSACESPSNDDYGAFQSTYAVGAVSAALAVGSDDALEPNDTCAAAVALAVGTNNGLVVKGVDEDWYSISIPGGQQLTVTLTFTHNNGDIDTTLHATCGGPILASGVSTTNNESFTYTNTGATATFRIRVYLFGCDTRNSYNMTRSLAAVAPPNNNCTSAINVGNGDTSFSTVNATTDGPNEPTMCNFFGQTQIDNDIWYRYTATCTGQARVSLCDSTFDTKVAVYGSACPASASALACNDDACGTSGLRSDLVFNTVSGNQYLIRIGNFPGAATGTGTMRITCPFNDDCAGAPTIGNGTYSFSNVGATTDGPNEPGQCNFFNYTQVGSDIWYRYVAACNAPVTVRLCSSTYDTKLAIYSGANCPTTASAIACNDDACGTSGLRSSVTFNASSGATYRIRVGGFQGATGAGTMVVTCCPGDINFDGVVNVNDLLSVINTWGFCAVPPAGCPADINGDLAVNVNDLLFIINTWGACP